MRRPVLLNTACARQRVLAHPNPGPVPGAVSPRPVARPFARRRGGLNVEIGGGFVRPSADRRDSGRLGLGGSGTGTGGAACEDKARHEHVQCLHLHVEGRRSCRMQLSLNLARSEGQRARAHLELAGRNGAKERAGDRRPSGRPEPLLQSRQHGKPRASACRWRKRGAAAQGIGRSRGGLSTKVHLVVDALGLPLAFEISEGQRHDSRPAKELVARVLSRCLLADKAYDSNDPRRGLRKLHVDGHDYVWRVRLTKCSFCHSRAVVIGDGTRTAVRA